MSVDYGFISVIVSFGTLVGALLTIVKFWNEIRKKAVSEGRKQQKFEDVVRDINGLGQKVSDIAETVRDTETRVSNLQVEIKIKLEGIESALSRLEKRFNEK
jgi:hypothetical protein